MVNIEFILQFMPDLIIIVLANSSQLTLGAPEKWYMPPQSPFNNAPTRIIDVFAIDLAEVGQPI